MIVGTFKPIVSIVGGASTKPERINAGCTTIGESYEPTVERIGTGLLAQWDMIANSHVGRCSPKP
ncbi:MAG: hypothetical protein LV473_08750 [Nitrospira sp.]|nr:hypothetical protein [Nitrospira sp.]